jgi:hypothetical protein
MPGRGKDLLEIPDSLWRRAEMIAALRGRDMGSVFRLLGKYAGASQTRIGIACDMSQPKISGIMRGIAQVEALDVFERIAAGLGMPDAARATLGLAPQARSVINEPVSALPGIRRGRSIPSRDTRKALEDSAFSALLSAGGPGNGEKDEANVRRRTFVGLTGASLFGAILADTTTGGVPDGIEAFAAVLAAYPLDSPGAAIDLPPDMPALSAGVVRVKQGYQDCRYSDVTRDLPVLLTRLQAACAVLDGQALLRARTLSAEAHHVAASVLLKLGDQGLGWLAADRSMQAARASQDPVTIGSSARIITHAMMKSGHLKAATDMATTQAGRLDRDVAAHDQESLSVYGSLLLRGAVAAAQRDDRSTAHELLAEADDAGSRVSEDGNLRWTAFGPTNAKLHRVNIGITLGDAGTALDVARTVDLGKVTVTERKASFLVDTSRAFLQCGKYEKTLMALRAAEQIAPEEIAGRPSVRNLVRDLITTAPPSVQRHAVDFADQIGSSR